MLQPSALEEGDMEFCRSDKSVTLIPGGYEPSPIELEGAKNLGDMIRHIRQDPAAYGQVGQRLSDLDRLNDFSSPYHHLAADRPPPPTDAELKPMVQLALDIGRG